MIRRPLVGFVFFLAGWQLGACAHAPQPNVSSQPIIDVHFHAVGAEDQGPPPLAMCMSGESLPVWDPRKPWAEPFIEWLKKPA